MRTKRITKITILIFTCFMFIASCLFNAPKTAYADNQLTIEESNVLDDLKGSTIAGKPFSLSDYPSSKDRDAQLIYFAENGFSLNETLKNDYSLYFYVYNPRLIKFDNESALNNITFRLGTGNYLTYNVKVLSVSKTPGKSIGFNYSESVEEEGLFYKFKVDLSSSERDALWQSGQWYTFRRTYEISEFELSVNREVTSCPVASKYTYEGFAENYQLDKNQPTQLKCSVNGLSTTLTLDVKSTYYRPNGYNGKRNTQDSLHSVYFAVPNKILNDYNRGMTGVHARWLDAILQPSLVTGNQSAYNSIKGLIAKDIDKYDKNCNYGYIAGDGMVKDLLNHIDYITGDFAFNINYNREAIYNEFKNEGKEYIETLYFLYFAEGTNIYNNADTCTISSSAIESKLKEMTRAIGGEKVLNTYSKALFSELAEEFTDVNISSDDKYTLVGRTQCDKKWWEIIYNRQYETTFYEEVEAIQQFDYDDLILSDIDLSNKYFVNESDCADFKNYCESHQGDYTVYLFRYKQSEYVSAEATLYSRDSNFNWSTVIPDNQIDTNAYFFEMSVDLGFQIIDVTFTSDKNLNTIIPVIMTPKTIIHNATPPLENTDDTPWWEKLWQKIEPYVILLLFIIGALVIIATTINILIKSTYAKNGLVKTIIIIATLLLFFVGGYFYLTFFNEWLISAGGIFGGGGLW